MKKLLIDGRLVDPGRTFVSVNPATGEPVGEAADATVDDARAAVAAARRAFDETSWSTDLELRVRCIRQLHDALARHRDEFAELTIAECGHTPAFVAGPAFDGPVALLNYYADLAEGFQFTEDLGEHTAP